MTLKSRQGQATNESFHYQTVQHNSASYPANTLLTGAPMFDSWAPNIFPSFVDTCLICQAVFTSAQELRHHQFSEHKSKLHFCKHCNKYFVKKRYLQQHIKVVHTHPNRFQCKNCGTAFSQKQKLQIHVHTGRCVPVKNDNKQ